MPLIDGRYASVGVMSEVIEQGALPGGLPAIVVRGVERAPSELACPGDGQRPVGPGRILEEEPATAEAVELAREYRAVLENIL